MKRLAAVLMFGFAASLASACAGAAPEPAIITIDMSEYAFTPETIELQVGQEVTINLNNSGALPHEIMFGREVMMMGGHPSGYQVDFFENAGVEPTVETGEMGMDAHDEGEETGEHMEDEAHQGFMVLLSDAGDTATMNFTVTKEMVGEWEMGCFELDGVHYTSGMVGTLVVKP